MTKIQNSKQKQDGFTLVEMLVVIFIFSLITGAAVAIFISVVRLQSFSLSSQQLMNQTSYAMEYMVRLARMAKKDIDGVHISAKTNYEPVSGQADYLKFIDYEGRRQIFYLENYQLKKETDSNSLELTSDKFKITNLKFYVSGGDQVDSYQPRVTIFLEAEGKGLFYKPKIKLQATVSQRDLDIKE